MKKILLSILTIFLFNVSLAVAQQCDPEDPFCENVDDVPLDGGMSILIAAGVAYGASQLRKKSANAE